MRNSVFKGRINGLKYQYLVRQNNFLLVVSHMDKITWTDENKNIIDFTYFDDIITDLYIYKTKSEIP